MLYTEAIITKKGPLARVWLAAHWERKISKNQFLQTNIEKTVGKRMYIQWNASVKLFSKFASSIDAITTEQQEALTLRLSGQLLLGVVRIYSRKTRYLLEDCNDALVKLKTVGDSNTCQCHNSLSTHEFAKIFID
jgi:cohesin complex subunit SCC1